MDPAWKLLLRPGMTPLVASTILGVSEAELQKLVEEHQRQLEAAKNRPANSTGGPRDVRSHFGHRRGARS